MYKQEKYINIQIGEELDLNRVSELKDNAMLKIKPELWIKWDFEKNNALGLDIYIITKASGKKAWWICSKCNSSYDTRISDKTIKNRGCSYCSGRKVNSTNSLASLNPTLASDWHPTLNGKQTPQDVTYGSGKKAWWICSEEHEWEAVIASRNNGVGCPYCSHNPKVLKGINDLWITNSKLAKEWHPMKNGELTPYDVTNRSGQKVWWLGTCGHEWEAIIANRTRTDRKNKCPYCSSNTRKVLKGFNDIHTTHPKIASLLVNLDDGYRYSKGSDAIVDWKCSECGGIITRAIKDAVRRSTACPKCADGISVGEKTMYYLLLDNGISFDYDKINSFSNNRRYDFYLPDHNSIIEIHGEQHYKQASGTFGANRSLEEELINDKYKRDLAIKNGISNYFEIAILDNDIHKIREEIENSGLLKMLNLTNINWLDISMKSQKSLVLDVCRYYEENKLLTTSDIAYLFRLTQTTVIRYLKVGNELKICNYNPRERHTKAINSSKKSSKPVVKLTINKEFIEKYNSISEAHRATGINNIGLCCRENYRTANNFKWMYLSDYENKYGKIT